MNSATDSFVKRPCCLGPISGVDNSGYYCGHLVFCTLISLRQQANQISASVKLEKNRLGRRISIFSEIKFKLSKTANGKKKEKKQQQNDAFNILETIKQSKTVVT